MSWIQKDTTLIVSLILLLCLCANLVQNCFQFRLEAAKRLRTLDQSGLRFAVDGVSHQETWRTSDIGSLPILEILLNTVEIFAAVVTAVECSHIQSNGFSDGFQALVSERTHVFAERIGKHMRVHLPEHILVPSAIDCQRGITGLRFGGRPFDSCNVIADEIAHRAIDKLDPASINVILSEQRLSLLMEPLTERTLKIGKLLDLDGRVWVAHGIVIGHKMRARVHRHNFCNRANLGPNHGKDNQRCTDRDQTNREHAVTPFLLGDFLASFLAFTLPFETHENSLM